MKKKIDPKKKKTKDTSLKLESKSEIKKKYTVKDHPLNEKVRLNAETMRKPKGTSDKVWDAMSAVAKKKTGNYYPTNPKNGTHDIYSLKYTTQKRATSPKKKKK